MSAIHRIELAIHNDPDHNVIYAAVMTPALGSPKEDFTGRLVGLYRSTDQGDHWTPMDLPGDADGGIFLRGQTGSISPWRPTRSIPTSFT